MLTIDRLAELGEINREFLVRTSREYADRIAEVHSKSDVIIEPKTSRARAERA